MKKMFVKRETEQEISMRIIKLAKSGDYGICPPPMDAQIALNELCRFFLGENWNIPSSMNQEQANTEIVATIETKFNKYRYIGGK